MGPRRSEASGERVVYLDYLRVLATFAVMLIHITGKNWFTADVRSAVWLGFDLYESAARWCVPVFVMISGALFLGKDVPIETIYKKYILRLAISFAVWSAVYALFMQGQLSTRLAALVRGRYHMWFILMIAGLYMCLPFLRPVAADAQKTRYFLILWLVFACLLPQGLRLAEDFGGSTAGDIARVVGESAENLHLHTVLGYSGYFLLGHALYRAEISPRQRRWLPAAGAAGFVLTAALTRLVSVRTGAPSENYYGYLNANVLLEAAAVFVLFKYGRYGRGRLDGWVKTLSEYSFGAYLVHVLLIDLLDSLGLDTLSFCPAISPVCIALLVFVLSFAVSAALHRIPIIKKYAV